MSSARLLLFALILSPEISHAAAVQPAPIHVQLEVRSVLDCASRAKLVERIHSRSPKIRFVEDTGAVVVGVTFSKRKQVFSGEVAWLEADKPTQVRRLSAPSCDEAVDAVALILAITLDPTAVLESSDAGTSPPPAAKAVGVSPVPSGAPTDTVKHEFKTPGRPNDTSPQGPLPPPTGQNTPPPSPPQSLPRGTASRSPAQTDGNASMVVRGVVAGELGLGVAPSPMPGVAAFLVFETDRSAWFAPTFVFGGAWSWSATSKQVEGNADFDLGGVTLDACPAHARWSNVRLDTCATGLLGQFSATSTDARNASGRVTRPFAALGLSAILHLDLTEQVGLFTRLAPQFGLVRDEFEFGSRVFHEVAPITVHINLGVEGHAP